jgi:uncharacterized protein YbjQ (UPF0145 family)
MFTLFTFRTLATVFLAGLIGGAAASALAQSSQPTPVDPQAIPVYESVTATTRRFEIVKRLWIESRRSPLVIPSYESREQAVAAFREHAVSLGGNGVVNFGCYQMPGVFGGGTRLSCNGTIVRFL